MGNSTPSALGSAPALVVPPTPTTPGNRTALYTKEKHDLKGKLPPANVKLPLVSLTDHELIVFFYNSTARPIVAVRLYARGGPGWISGIINEHRVVKPVGYKRNTCSVHCNKAVKAFIKAHGEDWKVKVSTYFETADDEHATETIRHRGDELKDSCDYPVLDLFQDLIKYPDDDHSGVFTTAIRWCRDNNVNALVSQVHLIVEALNKGDDPRDTIDFSPVPLLEDGDTSIASESDLEHDSLKKAKATKKLKGKATLSPSPSTDTDAEISERSDDDGEISSAPTPLTRKATTKKRVLKVEGFDDED